MHPSEGGCKPMMLFASVDFPEPLSPTIPRVLFFWISKLMF
jgi:hypothetical protein